MGVATRWRTTLNLVIVYQPISACSKTGAVSTGIKRRWWDMSQIYSSWCDSVELPCVVIFWSSTVWTVLTSVPRPGVWAVWTVLRVCISSSLFLLLQKSAFSNVEPLLCSWLLGSVWLVWSLLSLESVPLQIGSWLLESVWSGQSLESVWSSVPLQIGCSLSDSKCFTLLSLTTWTSNLLFSSFFWDWSDTTCTEN